VLRVLRLLTSLIGLGVLALCAAAPATFAKGGKSSASGPGTDVNRSSIYGLAPSAYHSAGFAGSGFRSMRTYNGHIRGSAFTGTAGGTSWHRAAGFNYLLSGFHSKAFNAAQLNAESDGMRKAVHANKLASSQTASSIKKVSFSDGDFVSHNGLGIGSNLKLGGSSRGSSRSPLENSALSNSMLEHNGPIFTADDGHSKSSMKSGGGDSRRRGEGAEQRNSPFQSRLGGASDDGRMTYAQRRRQRLMRERVSGTDEDQSNRSSRRQSYLDESE
jgi:hypothetical protein